MMRKFVQFKFVKFKKRVKHPWKSVTFSKVAGFQPPTLLKVTLLHECFSRFFKLYVTNPAKHHNAETYSKPCYTSMMDGFIKVVNVMAVTNFAKQAILDV